MSHVTVGKKSETQVNKKDFWNTSDLAIADALALCRISRFDVDACSSSEKESKAKNFISPEDDALLSEWNCNILSGVKSIWCNPPFSQKELFLKRAMEQSEKHNLTVCLVYLVNLIS